MIPDELAASLAFAESDYRYATTRAEELRQLRNELVRRALEAGWTHQAIGEATGLSRGRISQIKSA